MAQIVNIHEAKTQFSKLIQSAINGEETIIAKSGKPVAKLVPIPLEKPKRRLGILKGKIKIADDFDAPLSDDILNSFEGHV
jgi:prevent-host-death family protein